MKNIHNLFRLIGGLIIATGIILAVVGVVVLSNNQSLAIGLLAVGIVLIIVGAIWYAIATSNSRKICDKCGAKMHGCAYEYQEKRGRYTNSGNYESTVFIRAECPECGAIKQFTKKFTVTNNSDNLQWQVDQFCRNHFGH